MEIINVESNDFCFTSYAVLDENGNHPGPEQSAITARFIWMPKRHPTTLGTLKTGNSRY